MAKFTAAFSKGTTDTTIGVFSLETAASSPRRIKLSEVEVGSDATTLGTSAWRFEIQRSTATATGTSVTPQVLDSADANLTSIVKSALSANGTLTSGAIMKRLPLNQQARCRWAAWPGSELAIPASASNGLHLLTPVAGGGLQVAGSLVAEEL